MVCHPMQSQPFQTDLGQKTPPVRAAAAVDLSAPPPRANEVAPERMHVKTAKSSAVECYA
jgi:hypothetical protein